MPFIENPGGKIYYDVIGDGTPMVLLRGLARSSRHWLGFDQRMAALGYQVICVDARGLGRSQHPAFASDSIFDLADDVNAVLKHLAIERAHVVGISLGGMVAMAHGLRYPSATLSLVLINSSVGGLPVPRLSLSAAKTLIGAALFNKDSIHQKLADVLLSKSVSDVRRQEIIAAWNEIEALEGKPHATAIKQLVAAVRFMPLIDLRRMQVPTLVVYGKDDAFVPTANSKLLHKLIRGSKLVGLDQVGHEATLDNPERLAAVISEFVTGVVDVSNSL